MCDPNDRFPFRSTQQTADSLCPSCARFIGATIECPYCGEPSRRAVPVIRARRTALFGAIIGLIVLWQIAVMRDIPIVQISDLNPAMNFAVVQIDGVVSRDARLFCSKTGRETVYFTVKQGRRWLKVFAYGESATSIKYRLPACDDSVSVTGRVNVRGPGSIALIMRDGNDLEFGGVE